jgi:hypothetical protein
VEDSREVVKCCLLFVSQRGSVIDRSTVRVITCFAWRMLGHVTHLEEQPHSQYKSCLSTQPKVLSKSSKTSHTSFYQNKMSDSYDQNAAEDAGYAAGAVGKL